MLMMNDVGVDAGRIWHLLSERGVLSIRKIGEIVNCRESVVFLALGWLARENKVRFLDESGVLYVELNMPVSETYY